jgi:DNA polymerase III epsilon subunit-like protein
MMPKIIDTRAIAQGIKTNYKYDGKEDLLSYQYKMINTRVRGVKTQLKILAKENDIPFDEAKLHDALYDLEVNIEVWNKLKYQIEL